MVYTKKKNSICLTFFYITAVERTVLIMKKRKSLLKTSVFVLGTLEIFNKVIDSSSIVNTNTRTGGKYYHWKHGDIFYHVYGEKGNPPLLLIHDLTVGSSSYEWHHPTNRELPIPIIFTFR